MHSISSLRILVPFLSVFSLVSVSAAVERPNILWLSCEDISPHLGCYGDPHATTPVLDQLATEGIRYKHAFVAAGVCAPCRSTIITGMYQTTIGTHHMRCRATLPEHVRPFTMALREAGYYCTNNSKTDYQFNHPKATWDESSGKAHWRRRPDKDQPFFSVFNFTGCHESGIASKSKYESVTKGIKRHDRAELADSIPPYYPDTPIVREDWARNYDLITAMDRWAGGLLKQLEEDGLAENTIVFFWSDHGVGLPRAKRWLYDSGMRVPLIVRMPKLFRSADQGKPGSVEERLVSLMDLGPTVLNLCGMEVPSHMQGAPFLGADLPEPRKYVYGARDRMDERYDIIRAVSNGRYKYIRNYEPWKTYYQYMNTPEKGATMQEIRRVAAKGELPPVARLFMAESKPVEELYDLVFDPHEVRNLAKDPDYAETLKELRQAHLDWVLETKDIGLIPESEIVTREQQFGSRYAILRQQGADDLMRRIRDMASLTLDGSKALSGLLSGLSDEDSIVRYWALIGLGNISAEAKPHADAIRQHLRSDSAAERTAAARALARMGNSNEALPVLTQILADGRQWERLAAVIVLDEMEDDARPALSAMQSALKPRTDFYANGKYTIRVTNKAINDLLGTKNTVP